MACGSNQFGQLGQASDMATEFGEEKDGGYLIQYTPVNIEKRLVDNVVYIACGRQHNLVIRQLTQMEEEEQ